jgi:hypothetical protein
MAGHSRRTAALALASARPSTSFVPPDCKDVDAQHKAGHDERKNEKMAPRGTSRRHRFHLGIWSDDQNFTVIPE